MFAEYCVWPVPLKQRWHPEYLAEYNANWLHSVATRECLRSVIASVNGGIVKTSSCTRNLGNLHWRWSDVPDPG